VAQIFDKENVPFFVVDSLYEAQLLRNEKIKTPLLIVGYTFTKNLLSCRFKDCSFTIGDLEQLAELEKVLKSPKTFHLKIDTGMHRQGIELNQIGQAIALIKRNCHLRLEGICSHLADADNASSIFTLRQIKIWNSLVALFQKDFPKLRFFHIAATAGIRFADQTSANMARLGLGLYGINPSPFVKLNLKPALAMRSIISGVKSLKPGEAVGYGLSFVAKEKMKLAVIPVGYFEGVDWRLSNRGYFKIGEEFCPIIGRVSMNISTIDVSNIREVKINAPVTVISNNPLDPNSIENIAKLCMTIPYEILVHIPQHLRRVIV
jgi:alanine racemase